MDDTYDEMDADIIGRTIRHYHSLGSTNTTALELAEKGALEGTVVVADIQTGGKGRYGREWTSPEGGLWMSILLRPQMPAEKLQGITLMVGVAVARVLRDRFSIDARIKWPNDILVDDKKIAGILVENHKEHMVIGIGINGNFDPTDVFPQDLAIGATSLMLIKGKEVSIPELLNSVLSELDLGYQRFLGGGIEAVIDDWKSLTSTLGREVRIELKKEVVEGVAVDLNSNGALVIRTQGGEEKPIFSGECLHAGHRKIN